MTTIKVFPKVWENSASTKCLSFAKAIILIEAALLSSCVKKNELTRRNDFKLPEVQALALLRDRRKFAAAWKATLFLSLAMEFNIFVSISRACGDESMASAYK